MTIFMDIELVAVQEADFPDAYTVTFDVIYAGETWCRSMVEVEGSLSTRLAHDDRAVVAAARDGLLQLLVLEAAPVSFHLRLGVDGPTVIARGTPGG
jgi:hypothetical protein